MSGYMGKVLWVDLEHGTFREEPVPEQVYADYLSGVGLCAYYLSRRIPAGADPLGAENVLAFASGLLTGTGSLFSGRWLVAAKSPLTGTWGDANCGGTFSPAIKQCGWDAVFFTGVSPKPVYLYADNHGPQLRDAADLWGLDTADTETRLIDACSGDNSDRGSHKKKAEVACIGPAGERLSLISGICNDYGRIAARSGLGAVMGSKRLKALVLAGSRPVRCADRERVHRLSTLCRRKALVNIPMPPGKVNRLLGTFMRRVGFGYRMDGALLSMMWSKWGTSSMNQFSAESGDAPIKNWDGTNEEYPPSVSRGIDPDIIRRSEMRKYHCFECPLGCGGVCELDERTGGGRFTRTHKPEYESIIALSALNLSADMAPVFYMNELLNRAGMDTISAGGTIAFAIECFERGIIGTEDTGGLELRWGDGQAAARLAEMMVAREGIGDLLADGSKAAAAGIGNGSEEYAVTAGGQELPMHDPRNDPGYGVHYSVEPTPGRHTIGAWQYYEMYALWNVVPDLPKPAFLYSKAGKYEAGDEKVRMATTSSDFSNMYNGAGICLFGALLGIRRVPVFDWVNAAAGWDRTPEEYLTIGRRVRTLRQLFNIDQGIDPWALKLHPRASGRPPQDRGANKEIGRAHV
jgi:aldehyde:ferredoxin oxidoreductase